jgi:hypothetical protein
LWLVATLLCATAPAAELRFEDPRLIVSGMLDGSSIVAFKEQLASGRVRAVVFEDSLGGSPEVALEVARTIRAGGISTEIRGQCHAACAYAFLAGKEHRFSRGFQVNGLLIPVARRMHPAELATRWSGSDAHMRTLAEFIPAEAEAAPRERWQANQGVLFISTPTLFGRVYTSFYCDGTQGRDISRCELLPGIDPFKLGILMP